MAPPLDQIRDAVLSHAHPRRIVLFGSQARGDARPDSDYDLLVIEDGTPEGRFERLVSLRRAMPKIDASIDLILTDEEEWRRWSGGLNHLFARAAREGKVLYECP